MATARKHTAKHDIYKKGAQELSTTTKSGFRRNRSKPFDATDTVFCPKGETYYSWSFRFGGQYESRTAPKPSQLTQSSFMQPYLEMQERVEDFVIDENIKDSIEELISDCENLRDEQQEKLDNMPEGLQQGSTGELIQERIDSLESIISDLQSCIDDHDFYDELDESEIEDIKEDVSVEGEDFDEAEFEGRKEKRLNELNKEVADDIHEQLTSVDWSSN